MRGLALCLVAGAIAVAGCGSDDDSSSKAPAQENVAASSGTTAGAAGVSAKGRATPASLCTPEGKGKPKKQCVNGLKKLDKGKVSNPKAACKGLSKKKTKGVRGKSPFAVCVKAAAKLMAGKNASAGSGNGAADSSGDSDDESDAADASDDSGSSGAADEAPPICRDAKGKNVPFDSEDVEECDLPGGADDDDSASSSNSDDDSSSDDSSEDDE